MDLSNNKIDFSTLTSSLQSDVLLQRLTQLNDNADRHSLATLYFGSIECLEKWSNQWHELSTIDDTIQTESVRERLATEWLIQLFNTLFYNQRVVLARSESEPEYFPAEGSKPARIEFAHGFFASALHEISHWCVAGEARRRLPDFGYWYAPDGRTAAQQQAFERVEIKPQALECLFTLACSRRFQVSQDNLFADFDTSGSTFAHDVYQQVENYIAKPQTLPRDAKMLLGALLSICIKA